MRVVYGDILFFLNLLVDYLLLLLTAKLSGLFPSRRRLLLGAVVGALLAVLLYFPVMPPVLVWTMRLGSGFAVVLTAFGTETPLRFLRLCGLFLLLTLVFAGVILALQQLTGVAFIKNSIFYAEISIGVMVFGFTAVYVLSGLVLGKGRSQISRAWHEITAVLGNETVRFRALEDSGNLLRDPISGRRIIVVDPEAAAPLLGMEGGALLQVQSDVPAECLLSELRVLCGTAFWLLPIHTAAQKCLLLAFRPQKLYIDGKLQEDYLLGITKQSLDIGGDCRALIGV